MTRMEVLAENDGMYKEKNSEIQEIKFGANQQGRYMKIQDDDNDGFSTNDKRVFWRIFRFLKEETDYDAAEELKQQSVGELSNVLTEAIQQTDKDFKLLILDGELINIVSQQHKQIPWSEVREAVENGMVEVFGEEPDVNEFTPKNINFEMPADLNEYVQGYFAVDLGSNAGLGRASILTFPRTKTINNVLGDAPACLNWSRAWIEVDRVGNLDSSRLNSMVELDIEDLGTRTIHTSNQEMDSKLFTDIIADFKDGIQATETVMDESVEEELTRSEMAEILFTYYNNDKIPKYIIPVIVNNIEDQSVWGLSQAISYVRTHGTDEFRTRKGDPFNSDLADNLERISSEIISVTPMIHELHDRGHDITQDLLANPPEEFEVEEPDKIETTEDIEHVVEQ